jgi:signal transduction histidine kinase
MIVQIRLLLLLLLLAPATSVLRAQGQSATPKRVLVLYWYDRDFPGHIRWDQAFRTALESLPPGSIEYYPEYLETNRFPGEIQAQVLRDYLKQKYADRPIDVVVAQSETSLSFLIKYRNDLFTQIPIVFYSASRPKPETFAVTRDVTGVIVLSSYRRTLDMALRLHPGTRQVFVISGTIEHDKKFESIARDELRDYEKRLDITYLTDLPPHELTSKTMSLPQNSIVLYVWQQSHNEQGKLLESVDNLASIGASCPVPIYGMSGPIVSSGVKGMVGGYVYTPEAGAAKVAELTVRIVSGERASEIAIENVPTVPMFDWRELKRWGINEESLPPGSIIRFRELTFWQQYKWRVIGALTLILLQTSFITVLLMERKRRQRAREALDQLNTELEQRIAVRTAALNNKSRELETFAYSVAHDLKAPLRGIDGYSRLLLEDYSRNLDAEGRSFLATIQTSTEEMRQLIDDLLEYSRLERRELKPERFELSALVSTVTEQCKREASAGGIDLVVKVNGGSIVADANGILQSLRNYIDNAIKFTRKVPHPRIEIGSKETLKNVVLWVRDNGVGFDMKYHDRIFDIFQRLNPIEDYPGTGVGLAIVRKSMERIGGRAWAESQPDQGATFYLEIPKLFEGDLTE